MNGLVSVIISSLIINQQHLITANVLSPKTGCVTDFCQNDGTCALNSTGSPVCTCLVGYQGDNCEITPCMHLDPCVGRGDCEVINHDPVCTCNQPWAGTSCQTCDCGDNS